MRTVLMVAVSLLLACDKTVATAPGTTIVDVPEISKLTVASWAVGAPKGPMTKVAKTYRYEETRFKVSFEHGPLEFIGAAKSDKPDSVQAPRAIRIEVVENKHWAMTAKCEDALAVPLEVNPDGTSAYPRVVWAMCKVDMKGKRGEVEPSIEIFGDGKIRVGDQRIVED